MSGSTTEHRLTVEGTCTCGFAHHKVRFVRGHITKANKTTPYLPTAPEAVVSLIARSHRVGDCLLVSDNPTIYPSVKVGGESIGAHRAVVLARGEELPPGTVVRHTCDVRGCIESSHLVVGTQAQNIRDMYDRDRFPRKRASRPDHVYVRERANYIAAASKKRVEIVHADKIPAAVALTESGHSLQEVADQIGVSRHTAWKLLKRCRQEAAA